MKNVVVIFTMLCLLIGILTGCAAESSGTTTTTTTPSTTTTTPPATPVQDDNGPGVGGVDGNWYFQAEHHDAYDIQRRLVNLVGKENYTEWTNGFKFANPSGTREYADFNSYTLIKELNIPREVVENALSNNIYFSAAQIEAIYNGTEEDIVREFASPYAIVIGTKIYSPKWLYEHTVEEYVAEGITFEIFRDKLPQIIIPCDTEDKWTTILAKYDEFHRLQEPSYTGKVIDAASKVAVGGKEYTAQWLAAHTAEDYRDAGITYDLLSENIVSILIRCHGDDRLDVYNRYVALKAEASTSAK